MRHHYILTNYPSGWALGECKWCKKIEPFRQYPQHNAHNQVIPTSLEEKRKFLISIGKRIHSSRWEKGEKEQIIESVKIIGINKTAKKFGLPTSTVGIWAKGKSPIKPVSQMYSDDFKLKCVNEYRKKKNFYRVAKELEIPRSTLQKWVAKYNEVPI